MIDIVSFLPAKRKHTSSGWISFNAVCCTHRGDNQDRRQRGGMKPAADGSWSYHCFNCGYTASFVLGRTLSHKAKNLLEWLGVDEQTINQINLDSLKHRSIHGMIESNREVVRAVEFEERDLPEGLELLDDTNPEHQQFVDYLQERKVDYRAYPYMVSPAAEGRASKRIVIPFTHNNMIVGNTSRYIDNRTPKYISDLQHGYVFGTDLQQPNWQHAIVVEGIFDALAINGLAVMHNDINPQQIQLIKSLGRSVTVVPDQDEAGLKLIDQALELGWAVSIPDWAPGVKDINDAVVRYGRLTTLVSVLSSRETSRIKIEMKRKQLVKRFNA